MQSLQWFPVRLEVRYWLFQISSSALLWATVRSMSIDTARAFTELNQLSTREFEEALTIAAVLVGLSPDELIVCTKHPLPAPPPR
jgi:hypothetical protein